MAIRNGLRLRCIAVALVVLTAAVTVTATAEGWRRPSSFAVSSSSGGDYRVCRDGIRFQIASYFAGVWGFTAYSPPQQELDPSGAVVGGTAVAEGEVTQELLSVPILDEGFMYLGTVTQRWTGQQLLPPSPGALGLVVNGSPTGTPPVNYWVTGGDDIADCLLFKPFCRGGATIEIPEDQAQPGDVPGACPTPPNATVCRDGKTISVPEDQVQAGDVRGECSPSTDVTVCRDGREIVVSEDEVAGRTGPGCKGSGPSGSGIEASPF